MSPPSTGPINTYWVPPAGSGSGISSSRIASEPVPLRAASVAPVSSGRASSFPRAARAMSVAQVGHAASRSKDLPLVPFTADRGDPSSEAASSQSPAQTTTKPATAHATPSASARSHSTSDSTPLSPVGAGALVLRNSAADTTDTTAFPVPTGAADTFPATQAPPPSPSTSLKRPRSPPFEWAAEPEVEDPPLGYLSLKTARTVNVEIKPRGGEDKAPPMLPVPLPSKRAKKTGGRAVLVPVEQLPVFPLPPLPPINDEELLKQVFTHSSLFERERGLFEYPDNKPARHYEKLEHVGDAILGVIVTAWLQELKPGLTCGTATKLKAHLVSNATLSHISGMYNFPQRLNGDPRLLPLLRAQTDVRAAIVEAYIAALFLSYPFVEGFVVVNAWLREMYEPLYDFFYKYMRAEYEQHNSAMGAGVDGVLQVAASPEILDRMDERAEGMALLVNMWGKCRERRVEWDCERYETSVGALWRMRLSVDGVEMGDATRATPLRAKNASALQAAKKLGLAEE